MKTQKKETTFENLVINPVKQKEHFLIGSDDLPAMAVIYANADTAKKLICEAVSENLDAEKVKVVKISDFNHKTFQQEAKVKITLNDETEEEIIYLTPISIYK